MAEATFPDKNVLIDAAEALAAAWEQCTGLSVVEPSDLDLVLAAGPQNAVDELKRLGLDELAGAVRKGTVPLEMARLRVQGWTLTDVMSVDPTPTWLIAALARSPDVRLQDLAPPGRETTIVVTTEVVTDSQRILVTKGFPKPLATALVQALVRDVHMVALPFRQREAIASGALDDIAARVAAKAPKHMAAVDWDDAFWTVDPESVPEVVKEDGVPWRAVKEERFDVYGVDGEDLFLLWQLEYCAAELGVPVRLATSDAHCARAAVETGICRAVMYPRKGSGYTREFLGERRVVVARPPAREPRRFAPAAPVPPELMPSPASMRRPSGMVR
jgi:hypothetical protein